MLKTVGRSGKRAWYWLEEDEEAYTRPALATAQGYDTSPPDRIACDVFQENSGTVGAGARNT